MSTPPAGFNPSTATDAELLANGYPGHSDPAYAPMVAANIKWLSSIDCGPAVFNPPPTFLTHSNEKSIRPDGSLDSTSQATANYSGRQASHPGMTDAEMEYTQPKENAPSNLSAVIAIWPGVGGGASNSNPLIQAGTETNQGEACAGLCDSHTVDAWWEVVTSNSSSSHSISNFNVSGGDKMYVHVIYSASGKASFGISDMTTGVGVGFSEPAPAGDSLSVAEWVGEREISCGVGSCTYPSLMNFGNEQFLDSQAAATAGGIGFTPVGNLPHFEWCIKDGKGYLAKPGPINTSDETDFDDTWLQYGVTDPSSYVPPAGGC